MSTLLNILKFLFMSFMAMASIAYTVDALTGWGEKGEHKKTVHLTVVLFLLSFGFMYVVAKID